MPQSAVRARSTPTKAPAKDNAPTKAKAKIATKPEAAKPSSPATKSTTRKTKPAAKAVEGDTPARSAVRPIWTGQLRLALVTVPVLLVPGTRSANRMALHQIHAPSGKRIHYDKVVPGIGSVKADDIKRAVEVSKGRYVVLEEKELETLKIEAKRTLEMVQFVEHCEIDPLWFDKPYFVLPDGELAAESYGIIRDALRSTKKMGIGQFVMRGHDYVAALKACGDGIMLETLRFSDEVRTASSVFAGLEAAKPDKELLELAAELIRRKSAPFDPSQFHDRHDEALKALVEAHVKNHRVSEVEDTERRDNAAKVIDLVEALKRSVRSIGSAPESAPAKPARQRKAG